MFIKRSLKYLDQHFLGRKLETLLHPKEARPALLHVNLDVTSSCNLRCQMCSLQAWYPNNASQRITPETLTRLMPVIQTIRSIDVQCNCEPLLHPDLVNIISRFKQVNPTLFVALVTNGMLLTTPLSEQLIDSGLDKIGFSIDGACAETYEAIRTGGQFNRVLGNIREFLAIRQTRPGRTPRVELITVACRDNLTELPDILQLGRDLGVETYTINGLEPYTEAMARQVLYESDADARAIFDQLIAMGAQGGLEVRLPSLTLQPYAVCQLSSCVIDTAGNVFPCAPLSYQRPFFYAGTQFEHPRLSFGTIADQNLLDIWDSEAYTHFRANLLRGEFPEYCRTCLMNHKVLCPIP